MGELIDFVTLRDDIISIFNLVNTENIQSYTDIKEALSKISYVDTQAMNKIDELVNIVSQK